MAVPNIEKVKMAKFKIGDIVRLKGGALTARITQLDNIKAWGCAYYLRGAVKLNRKLGKSVYHNVENLEVADGT
jgi:hypothetical protein